MRKARVVSVIAGALFAAYLLPVTLGSDVPEARDGWNRWLQDRPLVPLAMLGAALSLIVVGLVGPQLRTIARGTPRTALTEGVASTGVLDLVVDVGQAPHPLFMDYENPDLGRYFWMHNVLITNRGPRKVSLMPKLAIELNMGNSYILLEPKGFQLMPKQFTGAALLLQPPLSIDPDDTISGDLGYAVLRPEMEMFFGMDYEKAVKRKRGEFTPPVMYLVLQDRVTGLESAHEVTYARMKSPATRMTLDEIRDAAS